jgi:hypothetical protein
MIGPDAGGGASAREVVIVEEGFTADSALAEKTSGGFMVAPMGEARHGLQVVRDIIVWIVVAVMDFMARRNRPHKMRIHHAM